MHISDFKYYERCKRLLWLKHHQPKPYVPFVYYNESMSELLKQYFHLEAFFEGKAGDDASLALAAVEQYDALLNARFSYANIRIKIPLMRKTNAGWCVYFTYAACFPREQEAIKLADTITVLEACGIVVSDVQIIHLNCDYIRKDVLDVNELFIVTPYLYNKRNHANYTALSLIRENQRPLLAYAKEVEAIIEGACMPAKLTSACTKGRKCPYYDECFGDIKEDTSIVYLMQSARKYELMEQGCKDLKEIDVDYLEGTRQQYAQVMAARNNGFFMDDTAIRYWVKENIHYPLSYLDFEWETFVYPPYQGMKPFDVLVFQYSLHVEKSAGAALSHNEFIGDGDCRIAFIEHLLAHIPAHGTILVYNMEGAEKLRLKQLSVQFPQYEKALLALCERMVDLSLPFESGSIYDSRMQGYYSLKKLVEVFNGFDYHSLDISQGLQAAQSWLSMQDHPDDQEKIRDALFQYCAMDTYAEYIIFHKILALLKESAASKQETA